MLHPAPSCSILLHPVLVEPVCGAGITIYKETIRLSMFVTLDMMLRTVPSFPLPLKELIYFRFGLNYIREMSLGQNKSSILTICLIYITNIIILYDVHIKVKNIGSGIIHINWI